jgi:hypothetical protein
MTEPSPSRPVPAEHETSGPETAGQAAGQDESPAAGAPFADLEQLPVAEHVPVFEAEHTRLQDELSTIDQV